MCCIVWCILTRLLDSSLFFFKDSAAHEIFPLSPHDALPISRYARGRGEPVGGRGGVRGRGGIARARGGGQGVVMNLASTRAFQDRKSTRLNSSNANTSNPAFCLKKKKNTR